MPVLIAAPTNPLEQFWRDQFQSFADALSGFLQG